MARMVRHEKPNQEGDERRLQEKWTKIAAYLSEREGGEAIFYQVDSVDGPINRDLTSYFSLIEISHICSAAKTRPEIHIEEKRIGRELHVQGLNRKR